MDPIDLATKANAQALICWAFDCAIDYYQTHKDKLDLKTSQAVSDFITCHAGMAQSAVLSLHLHEAADDKPWD